MSTNPINGRDYESLMAELGYLMSRISYEATGYAWHERVEEELPEVCYEVMQRGQPAWFDTRIIRPFEARVLTAMAHRLGHWVARPPGRSGWMPHIPQAMKALSCPRDR